MTYTNTTAMRRSTGAAQPKSPKPVAHLDIANHKQIQNTKYDYVLLP